jgi:hypothetical protein
MREYLKEINPYVPNPLINLENDFKNHFPEQTFQQPEWMRNPSAVTISEKICHLSIRAKELLMKLYCDNVPRQSSRPFLYFGFI